jgi:hypothetical protein
VVLLLGVLKMTSEQAIAAYIRLLNYMHPSMSLSTDLERTKHSERFKEEFINVLKSVDLEEDASMQQSTTEVRSGET